MGVKDFVKKHKKGIAIGALGAALIVGGEGTTGCVSKLVGATLSATGGITHTQKKGQFWQAIDDYDRIEDRLKGRQPREPSDGTFSLFPDPQALERWPLTPNNEIAIRTADEKPIVTRYATREQISYAKIPQHVRDAFILREDRGYWSHDGVNWRGKFRIPFDSLRRGRLVWNSGITEQVAKWMFTPRGRTTPPREGLTGILHKVFFEVPYAMELDHRFSKEKILEFYLNNAYFGDRNFGIVTAAQSYFGKDVQHLTLPEALFLAVLVNNPGRNPKSNGNLEFQMREYHSFVESLHSDGLISDSDYQACKSNHAIRLQKEKKKPRSDITYPSALGAVSEELERYGIDLRDYLDQQDNPGFGFVVNTSLDRDLTKKLQASFRTSLRIRRDRAEGAAVILDSNGRIVAILGRRDYRNWGDRNLAVESRLPMASTIKPFIFGVCYDINLCTPADRLSDDTDDLRDPPKNWDNAYGRRLTLEQALALSDNVVTRRVYDRIPFYRLLEFLSKLGIDTNEYRAAGALDANNNALGSRHATVLEVAAAYNVFNRTNENGDFTGDYIEPTIISNVDFGGEIIIHRRDPVAVFRPETVKATRASLIRVANRIIGTGYQASVYLKTGTSDETVYAWTVGGFRLHDQAYSLAFVVLNEQGRSMGNNIYAAQIVGPVVHDFIGRVSPVFRVVAATPAPLSVVEETPVAQPSLSQICTDYNPYAVNSRLNDGDLTVIENLSKDMRSCAGLYEVGNAQWTYFRFYEGAAEEALYKKNKALVNDGGELVLSHLRNAIAAYRAVTSNSNRDSPYYGDANDKAENLEGDLERYQQQQ